jgi:hypothetical protein
MGRIEEVIGQEKIIGGNERICWTEYTPFHECFCLCYCKWNRSFLSISNEVSALYTLRCYADDLPDKYVVNWKRTERKKEETRL